MNRGQSVFAQLLDFVPFSHFEYLIDRYASNHGIRHFSAWTQFLCIAYSQLTRWEGLRDLVACLNSQRAKLYHIGIRGKISRSTLADANERRDWRLFEALGHRLIATALELYQGEDIGLGIKEPLYAMDSTTIDLCLSLFPWADFRSTKATVKAHTIIDLRGSIPVFVHITTGKVHDVKILDMIQWPAGAIVVVDRGYLDFTRLQALHQRQVSFVIRAKDNMRYTRVAWRAVDKSTGLRSDQSILLATPKSKLAYPDRLRRVSYRAPGNQQVPCVPDQSIRSARTDHCRDLPQPLGGRDLFKWIKQNLSIKHFFGNSINAVKSQIWIAVCVYLIVIIARKRLNLPASPQLLLNLFEVNMFEKIQLDKLVFDAVSHFPDDPADNQMILL